jgi:hypothetical protein
VSGRRKTRYSGALNQPIVRPPGLLYGPSSPIGARFAFRARLLKLLLLLEHYGFKPNEPDCWLKLAFRLAQDHVPGMQVAENAPRRKGRPRKPYDVSGSQEFIRIIDEIKCERRKGVMDAIRIALKRKQLQGSADSWEARYYENKKLAEELKRRLPTGFGSGPFGDPNLK